MIGIKVDSPPNWIDTLSCDKNCVLLVSPSSLWHMLYSSARKRDTITTGLKARKVTDLNLEKVLSLYLDWKILSVSAVTRRHFNLVVLHRMQIDRMAFHQAKFGDNICASLITASFQSIQRVDVLSKQIADAQGTCYSIGVARGAKGPWPPKMFRKHSHIVLWEAFF